MAYLSKEGLLLKLSPYGIKSILALDRARREQHLPTRFITPRKPFWVDEEVDVWLSRRFESVVKSNAAQAKVQRQQRKARKAAETPAGTAPATFTDAPTPAIIAASSAITAFKVKEA
jgi:hypothetical protein